MLHKRTIRRVGIYGPFGWGNLGDAAIQEAMIRNLRKRIPGVKIAGFSLNPDDTRAIHDIDAYPILRSWAIAKAREASGTHSNGDSTGPPKARSPLESLEQKPVIGWFVRKVRARFERVRGAYREFLFLRQARSLLSSFDVFVISGGGQLSDYWGGPWYHPFTLFKWVLCARLAGTKVYVVSVGAGPIRSRLTGVFIRWALALAHYRSYRDEESRELLSRFGFPQRDPICPDLAFSLPCRTTGRPVPRQHEKVTAGVSPVAYCYPTPGPWPRQDQQKYEHYLDRMSGLTAFLLESGHVVKLLSSQIRHDRFAFDDLLIRLTSDNESTVSELLVAENTKDLDHLLSQIEQTDLIITSRLHGVILSYRLHKPVLALSPHPKLDSVMRQFEQKDFCVDIERSTLDEILERCNLLLGDLPAISGRIKDRATRHHELLQEQYDLLFGPAVQADVPSEPQRVV